MHTYMFCTNTHRDASAHAYTCRCLSIVNYAHLSSIRGGARAFMHYAALLF